MKLSKKVLSILLIAALTFVVAACGGANQNNSQPAGENQNSEKPAENNDQAEKNPDAADISFVTGGAGGVFYPLGGGMAKAVNDRGVANVTVETSGASIENTRLLGEKEAELGILETGIAYYAANGTEMFEGEQIDNVRGIMTLYENLVQMVVMADSGIESFADLKGRSVVVGQAGSSSMLNLELVLNEYGLSISDLKPQYSGFSEGVNMLKDGQVEAVLVDVGIPAAAIIDIATQHKIKILSIDEDKIESIGEKYPYFSGKVVIPAGTYNGVDEDVITAGVKVMLATHADVDEDVIYEITKAIFEEKEKITAVHPAGASINIDKATEGMPIPLHPGAEKYLKEQGK